MKKELTIEELQLQNDELINRLEEAEQLIEAIKAGEVDAFALNMDNQPEIFTLQSGDYGYRMLVENINEGAVTLAEDGLIVYTNNYFHELLGVSYEDVIGNTVFNFIHPDSKETFNELFKEGLKEKSKGEINLVAGDKIISVYVSLTSLLPTLQTVGMIVTDLTEKKKQEEALQLSEEKFNKLFSSAPLGLGLSDVSTGKVVDVNQTLLDMIGYTREEYVGKTSVELDIISKNERDKIVEQIKKNGFAKNVEINLRSKSGKIIPVINSIETIIIDNKKYFLGAMVDITQRKNSEKEIEQKNTDLEKMNKELESFAYISSHDLQEPLRKIQTFSSRIIEKEQDKLSESAKEQFQRIQKEAARMQTLIEDLFTYSRTNTSEHHTEKTDLKKIIDEIKDDLKDQLNEKHATVEAKELGEADVIPFQFRQMMHNLIGNSLKFSLANKPPHIKINSEIAKGKQFNNIRLSPENKYCHISVADNGIGFDPEFKEKIFDVFQRLHGKDKYTGTGIGLAIVKKIVENHNGTISAESELGKGARFDIFIPVT
jgi:PAS domain S-box-containing protein